MLIVLFGLPGAGKNFIGDILKEEFGFFYYDVDDDIPKGIKRSINEGKIIDEKRRNKFFEEIVNKVKELKQKHKRLVIGQALLKESSRQLLKENFPETKFILVSAKEGLIYDRLKRRKNHLVSKEYAQKIHNIFEAPKIKHFIINNNQGKEKIIEQLKKILNPIPND